MAVLLFSFISRMLPHLLMQNPIFDGVLVILLQHAGSYKIYARIPGCTVQIAAGHFKQTQKSSYD